MDDRRWGDEAKSAYDTDDRVALDRLVQEAIESGDPVALIICKGWRGDFGEVKNG